MVEMDLAQGLYPDSPPGMLQRLYRPDDREEILLIRQAERLLKAEILSRCTPLLALPYEMQNRIVRGYMDYD